MNLVSEIDITITSVTSILGNRLNSNQYQIIDRGVPHTPKLLPSQKMGVYTFWYGSRCLKIGKAGPNSNARFFSQHYNPGSAGSTLAASILLDPENHALGLDAHSIGPWIKDNCQRIDILLDVRLGIFTLELVEAILHYKYEPKYEGFAAQR